MTKKQKTYSRAGVDVDLANRLKREIQSVVKRTHGPQVLGKIGGFGGLFRANFTGMRDPVLVASIDGVGTKLKIAFAMNKHDTVGADLVNHCVNDIAVLGARPLFFLDYIGCEKLEPKVFRQLLRGLSLACRSAGCALLGGETAQMPGMYRKSEYDLAGCIVGVVDRAQIIDGSQIQPGDVILGLASNGLHTNGYSLARKILFEKMQLKPSSPLPGSTITVGKELLRVHKNYQRCGRDVSGFQHGDRNGGDRRAARCAAGKIDPARKRNWSNRARLRENRFEIVDRPPRRTPLFYRRCGDAGSITFTGTWTSGVGAVSAILPRRVTRCRPARCAATSTSSATRDFSARARVHRNSKNSP